MDVSMPKFNYSGDFLNNQVLNQHNQLNIGGGKRPDELERMRYIEDFQKENIQMQRGLPDKPKADYGNNVLNSLMQQKQKFEMPTQALSHPADLSSADRLATRPEYNPSGVANPNTVGDTISGLMETVHDKTVSYEEQAREAMNKSKLSPLDQAKNTLISSHDSIAGAKAKQENQKTEIEQQIEGYLHVMQNSYEYYIFTSLTIDTGKGVSQTANSLTKG